jgi:nitrate reductase delta subunit
MLVATSVFDVIAELLEYPTAGYAERLSAAMLELAQCDSGAAGILRRFEEAMKGRSLEDMEELYIQTFDMNPDASLEIGWHLFGEDYARGEFLVKLRGEMRRYGVVGSTELPDSLLTVLPLLARMPEEEAEPFRARFIVPALEKLRKAVPVDRNPFGYLLAALATLLTRGDTGRATAGRED